MSQSYENFIEEVVRQACERGEVVDTAAVADAVTAHFPAADRRTVVETVLSAVVWANGNASVAS